MKKIFPVIIAAVFIFVVACSGDGAKQRFETAEFEELQHNREHAAALYEEIIRKYPDSEYTGKAKDQLSAMNE